MRYLLIYFFAACQAASTSDCGPTVKAWADSYGQCEEAAKVLYKKDLTPTWMCVRLSDEMIDLVPPFKEKAYASRILHQIDAG